MKVKKVKFVVGSAVVITAVLYLAISGFQEGKAYYQTVSELKAQGARGEGRLVRVAGDVVPGTIVRRDEGVVTFDITYDGEMLPIKYVGKGPLPDTLVDRAQAVAEGHLQPDGTFEATAIQAKCASKYEAEYEKGLSRDDT